MTKSENLQRTVILTAAVVLATSAIGQGAPGARASADVPRPSLYLPLDAAALTAFPTAHVHVTVRGTPVFVEGRRGQALAVDARGAWLELAGTNLVDPEQGTIAFWMRPLDSPHPGASRRTFLSLLAPQNPDCAHFVGLYPDGSAYFLTEKDGVWLDSHFNFAWWKQPAWSTNIWHHLAVTWGTNQPVTFFVNGAKVFEQLNSRQSFSSQNAPIGRLVVGANGSGADLADAALDDIAIYRDTLTAAQLQRLMTEGPGDPATFVAYASVAPTAARTPQPAAPLRPGNQVDNPGFENPGDRSWHLNNWFTGPNGQTNVAEAAVDTNGPHAGTCCARITMSRHIGGDVQFQQKLPRLQPGGVYELRFWTRGTSNTKPVTVWVLKHDAPYTKYLFGQVSCGDTWAESVMRVVLPTHAPVDGIGLWFSMGDEGTFWLDDISLTALPAVEAGEPLAGNRVANGSFETGHDRWYADIHGPGGRYETYPDTREEIISRNLGNFEIIDTPDAPQGRKVLHWHNTRLVGMDLTSAKFRLRYGHPATVTFAAKYGPASKAPRNLWFSLGSGEYGSTVNLIHENLQIGDAAWHTFHFTVTPTPSADGRYYLEFLPAAWDSDFYLDAVTVAEGEKPLAATAADFSGAGWEPQDASHPGNVFFRDEAVCFRILASGTPAQREMVLSGPVLDAWERPVTNVTIRVPLTAGAGATALALPSNRYGAFKCELYGDGPRALPAVEVVYHVVPRLTPLKEVKDSFFGGHVELTPYNLAIAEKAGFRWLRYHGPGDTKWLVVQPKAPTADRDGFVFHSTNSNWLAGTRRACDMGFRIFGTFGKVPGWAEDKPDNTPGVGGFASYPPRDYDAWDRYVVETARAFAPCIDTWETWNEPDSVFLLTAPGYKTSKEEIVLTLARRARAALDKASLKVTLVGPAVADVSRPLSRGVLKKGITEVLDVQSFHCYGLGQLTVIQNEMTQWSALKDRQGRPVERWMSEGGITSMDIHTWLKTTGNAMTDPRQMARDAAGTVQIVAAMKAMGVRRNFQYLAFAQPSGSLVYRNAWRNMIDVNGIPFSPLPAHAAAVFFLEDAQPVAYRTLPLGGATLTVCAFATQQGKTRDVVWSSGDIGLQTALAALHAAGWQTFDMMANPLLVDATTRLGFCPVYLVE